MAKYDWALKGRYLLKGIEDLKIQGEDEELFPELFGYCDAIDLGEAIKAAKKIPEKKLTPLSSKDDLDNPDFNFIPDFFILNDFLAHTIYEEGILYMANKFLEKNYADNELEWFEVDEEHLEENGLDLNVFDEPMSFSYIDAIIYADGEPVEFDDILEYYGNFKKHHLDLDNFYWMGKSFVSRHNAGVRTPYGLN